ncbi:MAG: Zn-dependent hydrolase [Bacteroidales bacterium]|nr:Zn-dependent hydrolase [Bacteroidales bacterium]
MDLKATHSLNPLKSIPMKTLLTLFFISILAIGFLTSCNQEKRTAEQIAFDSLMQAKVNEFAVVQLTTDLSLLTENEKKMIPMLIEAARIMDNLFWQQAFAENKVPFLDSLTNINARKFAEINYGPWERLDGNKAFLPDWGEKSLGANFYPKEMTKEEFEAWDNPDKTSQYTLIWREEDGSLRAVWYHEAYQEQIEKAAGLLKSASALAEDPGLKKYLEMRAEALVTDDYYPSDIAWMEMKTNTIDIVVGPIENYEDKLFGYKTAYECAVLIKDKEWSKKLEKFTYLLPQLQQQLPVDAKYKKEKPGTGSDLNAYDIIYSTGDMNAGSKTIAINLPNDERVQLKMGSRRLQLKNAMRAKFDNILVPIAGVLIDSSQRENIKFDAFFSNVMFHEVGHGLGIKNTITGKGTVREALKEKYSAFEEAKADVLGLFITIKLIELGEITGITPEDCFVTYMAGMFRSVRFGAASAHGKANMMCFNFFNEKGAFERLDNGTYKVNLEKIREAMNEWATFVLTLEGDGNYELAADFLEVNGVIKPELQAELDLLKSKQIPVDIVYDQGVKVLGLTE